MKKYSIEEIQKKYDTLPPNVKAVYESAETGEALQQIGKEHKLMLDKLGELADETGLIILGLTHPKDYINNLSERLSIEKEEAKTIAEKVNQKIFQKIREELKKIHGIEENAEEVPTEKTTIKETAISPSPKPKMSTFNVDLDKLTALPTKPAPTIIAQPKIALAPNNLKTEISSPKSNPSVAPSPVNLETRFPSSLKTTPSVAPSPVSPFEHKLQTNEVLRSSAPLPDTPALPPPTPRYSSGDPYREPME